MKYLNIITTLIVIGMIVLSFVKGIKRKKLWAMDEPVVKDSLLVKDYLILAALSVWTLFIRIFRIASIPAGINQDGAMAAVEAKALATYGTDRFGTLLPSHLYAWGYGQMSSLLSYIMAPFVKLMGLNTLAMRLPIAIVSVMGAIAIFFIVKKLLGKNMAYLALVFTSICPWHFMQSRWALDCNIFPHVFIIGFCLLLYGIERKYLLYISMIFFGLSMYGYGVSFYVVPVFLIASGVGLLVSKRIKYKDLLISMAVYMVIAWPEYLTMLINFMKWDTISLPFVTCQYFPDTIRTGDMLFFSDSPMSQLGSNILAVIRVVILQSVDLPWNNIGDFGNIYFCSMPIVILGALTLIVYIVKKKELRIEKSIVLIYLFSAILMGIFINEVNVNRMNIVFYCLIILFAFGLDFIISNTQKLAFFMVSVYLSVTIAFGISYFTSWAKSMEYYFFKDYMDALCYVRELDCDEYIITPDVQYEGSSHVADILIQFAFDMDSRYRYGLTDEYGDKEIAFLHRFRLGNPYDYAMDKTADVAYVIKAVDTYAFDDDYEIVSFGNFDVVTPKH